LCVNKNLKTKIQGDVMKRKLGIFVAAVSFVVSASIVPGCGVARNLVYIKQKAVGVSNPKTQADVENGIVFKSKNKKIGGVKTTVNAIWASAIGYGSISKEERRKYSEKAVDGYFGVLFRYRFYYDYSVSDEILLLIDTDQAFDFTSAKDQASVEFKLSSLWDKKLLFNDFTTYKDLYTISIPVSYIQENQNKGIVIDFAGKKQERNRTIHIPKYYIKGFLAAINKYKDEQ
jgi:hypothetical protein